MRRLLVILLLLAALPVFAGGPVKGRIVKTLPLLLDLKGHDAISPSLYDRDAYQAHLRTHTNEVSGVRFDILWQVANPPEAKYKMRVEARGVAPDGKPTLKTLEQDVKPPLLRRWDSQTLAGDAYKKFGALVAWRVTLLADDKPLCEEKSFLW